MLLEIRQVKIRMLNMNEDQLVGTTKLTVIQNAQLTGELDYQSKQSEHLMYKNHQMAGIIDTLKKDLKDHTEVEKELAKRSHFCQKVVKKYKDQITSLKAEIVDLKKRKRENPSAFVPNASTVNEHQQNLMNYLNQRIKTIETKLLSTQQHLYYQEEEYSSLLEKM